MAAVEKHDERRKKYRKRKSWALKILKLLFVALCLGGFLYQTFEFLLLYWTYPTVVDIQQSEPSYLEMPAFTICNPIGYNLSRICTDFIKRNVSFVCVPSSISRYSRKKYCEILPQACIDGHLPEDITIIKYIDIMLAIELNSQDLDSLRLRLEDYMTCSIEFAGKEIQCNLENVLGSFYSKEDFPQFCYSIYSLWGQPKKQRELIAKGAVMHFEFKLNTTFRSDSEERLPKFNLPTHPSVQIAVHSPYFLPSPFLDGMSYITGRAYELRLTMSERHLLPSPYQTNCTDYLKSWKKRGGIGPMNQMGIVQECRVNKTHDNLGCVPLTLDYPHRYSICRACAPDPCNYTTYADECALLADEYTQPCDSFSYIATREDRVLTINKILRSGFVPSGESIRKKILAHNCEEAGTYWSDECGAIDVYILFDRFEITNLTYNPKFESLELFSVIGGYMGMWLGISLLTVYDFVGTVLVMIKTYGKKRRERTKLEKLKKKPSVGKQSYGTVPHAYGGAKRPQMW